MYVRILISLLIACSATGVFLGAGNSDRLAASGEGVEVLLDSVEQAIAPQIADLELERLRFQAEQVKKMHQLRESKLKELVGDQLLQLETASRGIPKEALVEEINSQAPEPTAEEIEKVYEANQQRFKEPKEQVLPRLETFIKRQKSQAHFVAFMESLADKYQVRYYLEPLRFEVSTEGAPSMGPDDAPVTIVEFSDFQCPYCARMGPTLKKITEDYGDRVRLVFRQFPLDKIHQFAEGASQAALCAADQGKFWEMHDLLFADQKGLAPPQLSEKAKSLELDEAAFSECLDTRRHSETIRQDIHAGMKAGVTGTPAFFVNGRPLSGALQYEEIAKAVDEELSALKP